MSSINNYLPKIPRFSWDIRQFARNDGKGSQEYYVNAVKIWSFFHNRLPEINANKMPTGLRGIMFHSHLYGLAKDLCKYIPFPEIESDDGVEKNIQSLAQEGCSISC